MKYLTDEDRKKFEEKYSEVNQRVKKNLRVLREYYGYSFEEIGRMTGYCSRSISYHHKESKSISLEALVKYAEIFNVNVGDLIEQDFSSIVESVDRRKYLGNGIKQILESSETTRSTQQKI